MRMPSHDAGFGGAIPVVFVEAARHGEADESHRIRVTANAKRTILLDVIAILDGFK